MISIHQSTIKWFDLRQWSSRSGIYRAKTSAISMSSTIYEMRSDPSLPIKRLTMKREKLRAKLMLYSSNLQVALVQCVALISKQKLKSILDAGQTCFKHLKSALSARGRTIWRPIISRRILSFHLSCMSVLKSSTAILVSSSSNRSTLLNSSSIKQSTLENYA